MMRHVFNELAIQSTSGYASLDRTTFLRYFPLPGIMGERLFSVFDYNSSGDISFQEFVTGMAIVYHGTVEEKHQFIFDMYDLDGDGVVTRDELATMLSHVPTAFRLLESYILKPGTPAALPASDEDQISRIVDAAFLAKPDGVLTFSEFKDLLSSTPAILEVLNVLYDSALPQQQERTPSKPTCPMCTSPTAFSHCMHCGSELKFPDSCHACHLPIPIVSFCFQCGQPLRHQVSAPGSGCYTDRGFLLKKGRWLGGSVERFFCLRDPFLYYYLTKEDTQPIGVIFLVGCEIKAEGEASLAISPLRDVSNRRVLTAKTAAERDAWVESLVRASHVRKLADHYSVDWENPLGKGKFSTVYAGVSEQGRLPVAIKAMNNKGLGAKEREMIRTEIAAAKLVRHPNVVLTFDIFESSTSIYVVMEKVNGGDLLTQIMLRPGRRLRDEEAAKVLRGMLAALSYLHTRSIVHRDIKPENTLVELSSTGEISSVKLTDFGLCAIVAHGYTMEAQLGTIEYAAPEIILNKAYDKSVDLWSLGCVLYVILSGRLPFTGNDDPDTADRIARCKYDFPGEWDEDAQDLVKHLIVKNPRHRFSVAQALDHPWLKKFA